MALELVGNPTAAKNLGFDTDAVVESLKWDIGLIVSYSVLLSILAGGLGVCYRLAMMRDLVRQAAIGAAIAAGVLDLLENACLCFGVRGDYADDTQWWWLLAATFSWAKWLCLAFVVSYVVGAITSAMTTPAYLRRKLAAKSQPSPDKSASTGAPRNLGICLSGGGIRSSSIALGALQVLERETGESGSPTGWAQAQTVTAISGGSNIASGFSISRTPQRTGRGGVPLAWTPEPIDADLDKAEPSPEERRLLGNLGYLLTRNPRGEDSLSAEGDFIEATGAKNPPSAPSYQPSAYATVFTGFLINALTLMLLIWVIAVPNGWLFRWLSGVLLVKPCSNPEVAFAKLVGARALAAPPTILLVVGLILVVLWVLVGKLPSNHSWLLRATQGGAFAALGGGVALLALLVVFPYLMLTAGKLEITGASLVSVGAALGSLGSVARILKTRAATVAPVVGGLAFGLLITFLAAYWSYAAVAAPSGEWAHPTSLNWWLAAVALALLVYFGSSPEWWALAGFYRGRLRGVYATFRKDGDIDNAWPYANDPVGGKGEVNAEPGLHEFFSRQNHDMGTPLVICTSCTVSTRDIKTHYGIPATSVTFTPDHVTMFRPNDRIGSWTEDQTPTEWMDIACQRFASPRLTTMLAVAISSAAVAPAMGRFRIGPTSMLLAFANLRLGVWMPNPVYLDTKPEGGFPRVRLGYLLKEFLGIHDPTDLFVYLTDGGHWENTGLVELMRTGPFKEVICIDADPGPGEAVKSLSEAIDLAKLETGADIFVNLDPLRAANSESGAPKYSQRSITLGLVEQGNHVGVLWYAKPALTEQMPVSLLAFRETHPDFPRVSTLNQFFDVSTFMAYRNLGRYNAQLIREARADLLAALFDQQGGDPDWTQFLANSKAAGAKWAHVEMSKLITNTCRPSERSARFEKLQESLRA